MDRNGYFAYLVLDLDALKIDLLGTLASAPGLDYGKLPYWDGRERRQEMKQVTLMMYLIKDDQ